MRIGACDYSVIGLDKRSRIPLAPTVTTWGARLAWSAWSVAVDKAIGAMSRTFVARVFTEKRERRVATDGVMAGPGDFAAVRNASDLRCFALCNVQGAHQ